MRTSTNLPRFVFVALLVASHAVPAAESDLDLDTRFRARLMKEKAKLNAELTNPALKPRELGPPSPEAECGSQVIGSIDTNGKPGTAPRDIFVYAPNAINIVNQRSCGN